MNSDLTDHVHNADERAIAEQVNGKVVRASLGLRANARSRLSVSECSVGRRSPSAALTLITEMGSARA